MTLRRLATRQSRPACNYTRKTWTQEKPGAVIFSPQIPSAHFRFTSAGVLLTCCPRKNIQVSLCETFFSLCLLRLYTSSILPKRFCPTEESVSIFFLPKIIMLVQRLESCSIISPKRHTALQRSLKWYR